MTTHSKLSPSKRTQWKLCPGSVREQLKYPDTGSGPAAIDGTHTHTLLDTCVKNDLCDPFTYVGKTLTDHEGDFTVDQERAARVKLAIEYVKGRLVVMAPVAILAESRVEPKHLLGRDDMGGTVDIQIHSVDLLELIDYKDGMGAVDAKDNDQLEQYAIGVLAGYGLPVNAEYPVKRIRMTIIQPKMSLKGLPPITSHEISVSEMLAKIPQMVVEAAATDAPDAPLVPGDKQCRFCRAKGCTARIEYGMKESGIVFQPVLDISQQAANKDPNSMTDAEIARIVEAAPLVRQMIEATEEEALRRMKAGAVIPGLKLVNGRGSRNWSLPEDQIADKLIKMGVPKGAVYETKLVSPAKAEKLTWDATKAGEKIKKQLSERQLKTLETEYVTKMAGKLTVAPESDNRPAVVTSAAPLFSAVAEVQSLPDWLK